MKNFLAFILITVLACMPATVLSQQSTQPVLTTDTSSPFNDQYPHYILRTATGNDTILWTIRPGIGYHQISWKSDPSVSAVTVTFSGAVGDGQSFTQIGTSSAINGKITGSGDYTLLKVVFTNYAGSGTIYTDWYGASSIVPSPVNTGSSSGSNVNVVGINSVTPTQTASGGLAVSLVEGAATTDYSGTGITVFTLSATSGTVITANTVYVTMLRCFNTTGGAVTINRTDTAANMFETSFSIPANSNYYAESPGSFAKMVGIKMWASAINSINCIMSGKQ